MAILRQKEKQFMEMYEAYAPALFRYCYYRVFDRDKANDCLQEAYCRTWRYLMAGKEIKNMKNFMYKTARNVIIDESRKKKMLSLNTIMEKGFSPTTDPFSSLENRLEAGLALKAMRAVSAKYRDVLVMKYVDDLSTHEIALATGSRENNVYMKIHRGLRLARRVCYTN